MPQNVNGFGDTAFEDVMKVTQGHMGRPKAYMMALLLRKEDQDTRHTQEDD